MKILRIDFETYSDVALGGEESVGVWNYANHPSTEVLMLGYKLPYAKGVELWEPHMGDMPGILKEALRDPEISVSAFNSAFERLILQYKLGIVVPVNRFIDPQVSCRYLSMPGDLDKASSILGLPASLAKDKRGDALIDLFCSPQANKKKRGEAQTYYKADWNNHPKEWEEFCNYCKQDVVAEEEVARRCEILGAMPLPPFERRVWEFDQKVNDRGIPVDREFVEKAYRLATRSKQEALDKQNAITGLENANSPDQLKGWLKPRGYPFNTLRKETVDSVLKDPEVKLTDEARAVLKARREASSTSYQKLNAILRQISPDNKVRGMFIFMGSPRCGRWSGNAVQLHNLARPGVIGVTEANPKGYDFEDLVVLREAREMILREDYDGIKEKFGSVLLTVKNCIRTVFVAEDDDRLEFADLNAIETRTGAFLAGCTGLMKVFEPLPGKPNGRCPYLDFASKFYALPNDKLEADYASKDPKVKGPVKRMRQVSKVPVLAGIYRMAGGQWGHSRKGVKDHGGNCTANELLPNGKKLGKKFCDCPTIYDKVKTGLWKYADDMGVDITQEQAADLVRIFRDSYPEIPEFWFALENAVAEVMKGTNTIRRIGPNDCVEIGTINILDSDGEIDRRIMYMQLPSGRRLHYIDARMESCKMPWQKDGEDVYRDSLVYAGLNQDTKQWEIWTQTHGGKLFENLVQGIARDVLAVKLLMFEEADIPIIAHVHDEGVATVPDDPFSPGVEDMVRIMSQPIVWAPGLLLGADGCEDSFYHK